MSSIHALADAATTVASPAAAAASSIRAPRIRVLRVGVDPDEVRRSEAAADIAGKHGPTADPPMIRGADHVLIAAPIAWLDHEYYDPQSGARDQAFFHAEREERLHRYAGLGPISGMPPIYLIFPVDGLPWHGRPLARVSNGNHRLEVAKRMGARSITAWMPTTDARAWLSRLGTSPTTVDPRTLGTAPERHPCDWSPDWDGYDQARFAPELAQAISPLLADAGLWASLGMERPCVWALRSSRGDHRVGVFINGTASCPHIGIMVPRLLALSQRRGLSAPEQAAVTLLHEVGHAYVESRGVVVDADVEEQAVEAFARAAWQSRAWASSRSMLAELG